MHSVGVARLRLASAERQPLQAHQSLRGEVESFEEAQRSSRGSRSSKQWLASDEMLLKIGRSLSQLDQLARSRRSLSIAGHWRVDGFQMLLLYVPVQEVN